MSKPRFNPLSLLKGTPPEPHILEAREAKRQQLAAARAFEPSDLTRGREAIIPSPDDPPLKVIVSVPLCQAPQTDDQAEDSLEADLADDAFDQAVNEAFVAAGYKDGQNNQNVRTFKQWLSEGRCVRKGQRSVRVEKHRRLKSGKIGTTTLHLFHVEQTEALTNRRQEPTVITAPPPMVAEHDMNMPVQEQIIPFPHPAPVESEEDDWMSAFDPTR